MVVSKVINGEWHPGVLENYVKRGNMYAGKTNDGKLIRVNGDCAEGRPSGYYVLDIPIADVPNLIAALTAAMQLRE